MTTNTVSRPKYTANQRVEVLGTDFETRGFPKVWQAGTVTEVELWDNGLFYVFVTLDRGGFGNQLVGKRGGNKFIRPLL